jgi:hypothetical protein
MTMRLPIVAIAILLLAIPAATPAAAADRATVESGFIFLDNNPSGSFGVDMALEGEGFTFIGEAPWSPEYLDGFYCTRCTPVSTRRTFHLRFPAGQVTDPSSNSSCPGCTYEANLAFHFERTPIGDGISQPFAMKGTLRGFRPGTGELAFHQRLDGSGTMFASPDFVSFTFAVDTTSR